VTIPIALIAGPMYDHLYRVFEDAGVDVDVVVSGDHPTLNRRVAEMLSRGERIDLLATHAKYTPSQAQWLHPLDDLVNGSALSQLAPVAVDLGRFNGDLLCVPRLIDVRVMWVRSDRVASIPDTWSELVGSTVVFGFPGRESGLFGTFFELVSGDGGKLFAADGTPTIETPLAVRAVERLVELANRVPANLTKWHYDQVDEALLSGVVDAAATWPGAWGPISRSRFADVLVPYMYPAGSSRRVSYSGCHAWAIPTTCQDIDGALELLHLLMSHEVQSIDAAGGNMCAHEAALAAVVPVNDIDRRRLEITRRTIDEAMICYPPLAKFPAVEDAGWSAIHGALNGRLTPEDTVKAIQRAAESALAP